MENLTALAQKATASILAGRTDEALLHLGILEATLSKLQPVGRVDVVPFLGGSVGYLNAPLPLGAALYAKQN